jgi:hypothetical protein
MTPILGLILVKLGFIGAVIALPVAIRLITLVIGWVFVGMVQLVKGDTGYAAGQ